MEYKMKGGAVLADADFERMSNDAAADNSPARQVNGSYALSATISPSKFEGF